MDEEIDGSVRRLRAVVVVVGVLLLLLFQLGVSLFEQN